MRGRVGRVGRVPRFDEQSEEESSDSDVERLAAESIDRRRQASIAKAVEEARAEAEAELAEVRKEHTAALSELLVRCQAADDTLKRLNDQLEESQDARAALEVTRAKMAAELKDLRGMQPQVSTQLAEFGARATAAEERLLSCEAERHELERGILRARDICAAKDAEVRSVRAEAAKAVAEAEERAEVERMKAVDAATRDAEGRLGALHAETASEAAGRMEALEAASAASSLERDGLLAERARLEAYVGELEGALGTARELVSQREAQLAELAERAAQSLRVAVAATERRLDGAAAAQQQAAVSAAMSAAAKAQTRAVERAVRAAEERAATKAQQEAAAAAERASTAASLSEEAKIRSAVAAAEERARAERKLAIERAVEEALAAEREARTAEAARARDEAAARERAEAARREELAAMQQAFREAASDIVARELAAQRGTSQGARPATEATGSSVGLMAGKPGNELGPLEQAAVERALSAARSELAAAKGRPPPPPPPPPPQEDADVQFF